LEDVGNQNRKKIPNATDIMRDFRTFGSVSISYFTNPQISTMALFDLDMIQGVYARMGERIEAARAAVGRPLTLSEKILYSHLTEGVPSKAYERGKDYVDFAPDRVAMQDATAQMALLQFMQAGRPQVAT
jgi:hypothetical protein